MGLDATATKPSYSSSVLRQIMDTLAPLRPFMDDPEVTDIMVNAPNEVFVVQLGQPKRAAVELSAATITAATKLLAGLVDREVGKTSGRTILSARLPGYRIEAVLPPTAVRGASMCIRRHASRVFSLDEYVTGGVIAERHAQALLDAVAARQTFLIAGGTGSGKTTFMNTALSLIDQRHRLFVIETIHELRLTQPDHVLIECDEDNGVTPRLAVRTALRYMPTRIVVGELRGPEAYDWLDGANTGHPGSAATIHANSAAATLPRLENLLLMADMGVPYSMVRRMVGETVDWVFYIERSGNKRHVSQVMRLHGCNSQGEYDIESIDP